MCTDECSLHIDSIQVKVRKGETNHWNCLAWLEVKYGAKEGNLLLKP